MLRPSFGPAALGWVATLLVISVPASSRAQWATSPGVNTPISTAAENQRSPVIASDGAGGAIIAWEDNRALTGTDIFAQHMSALGESLWTPNGIGVAAFNGSQTNPLIVPDNAGGAIVVWVDDRNDFYT